MAIKIFLCYAREDEILLNKLRTHLRSLQRQGLIDVWYDRDITAGTEWEQAINQQLNMAHMVLLLISPDFMDSDYCYGLEMKRALERHDRGEAQVIPVILRHVYWQGAPFGKLQALPTDARPVTDPSWHTLDMAFYNVVEGIHKAIIDEQVRAFVEQAKRYLTDGRYEESLAAYEQAIRLRPDDIFIYDGKGLVLMMLKRYEEALATYEQAIRLDPNVAFSHSNKGWVLNVLGRYEEAVTAYEQVTLLDPNDDVAHSAKGRLLTELGRYEEALAAYEQAISLAPNSVSAHEDKGKVLRQLGRQGESQAAYQRAYELRQ